MLNRDCNFTYFFRSGFSRTQTIRSFNKKRVSISSKSQAKIYPRGTFFFSAALEYCLSIREYSIFYLMRIAHGALSSGCRRLVSDDISQHMKVHWKMQVQRCGKYILFYSPKLPRCFPVSCRSCIHTVLIRMQIPVKNLIIVICYTYNV